MAKFHIEIFIFNSNEDGIYFYNLVKYYSHFTELNIILAWTLSVMSAHTIFLF